MALVLYFFLITLVSGLPASKLITAEEEINTRDDSDPYRLPTTVYPENYTITLKLEEDFGPSGVFEGSVSITLRTYEAVDSITLHASLLDINKNNISLTCGSDINIFSELSNDTTYDFITVTASEVIPNDTLCILTISGYTGQLMDDMRGFYRSSYTNANGETE